MDIHGCDGLIRLLMNKPIHVNISHNKAREATVRVLVDALQVLAHTYAWSSEAMETSEFLVARRAKKREILLISCNEAL